MRYKLAKQDHYAISTFPKVSTFPSLIFEDNKPIKDE